LVYSEEGTGQGRSPPRPLLAVPNVTAHTSTASVQITVLLHNGLLLCGFNVPIKGFKISDYTKRHRSVKYADFNDVLHHCSFERMSEQQANRKEASRANPAIEET